MTIPDNATAALADQGRRPVGLRLFYWLTGGPTPSLAAHAPGEGAGGNPAPRPADPEDRLPVPALPEKPWPFLLHAVRRGFSGRFALMMGLAACGQILESLFPWVLNRLVNDLAAGNPARMPGLLAAIAGLLLAGSLCFRLYELVDVHTSPRLRAVIQKRLFAYLMGHAPRFFQENFAGKLGQKIKAGGHAAVVILNLICLETVRILVVLVVACGLLFALNPLYAGILLGWSLAFLAIMAAISRINYTMAMDYSEAHSSSTGRMIDSISNADVVRAFARLEHERRYQGELLDIEAALSRRMRVTLTGTRLLQTAGVVSLLAGLLALAAQDTLSGALPLGVFTMVLTLGLQVVQNVLNLSNRAIEFFEQSGTLAEAISLVTRPHEIVEAADARPLVVRKGRIRMDDLHFAHADGTAVFAHLDLDIAAGEKVGLVGRSGAGKSTLIKLLRRQYVPQRGVIRIDDQDIAHVTADSLNAAIAEVPQVPGIFHRSVRDNIRYAKPEAEDAVTIAAARQAHCDSFIRRRPEGYGTLLGEQGLKLSGGERQRVAIARALVKDARILVLDEATSALDSESELAIQECLWQLMQGRTVIAIAHRLSTLTGLDRIIVLDGGRILEQGAHNALLAHGGLYARLWQHQAGGFLGDS